MDVRDRHLELLRLRQSRFLVREELEDYEPRRNGPARRHQPFDPDERAMGLGLSPRSEQLAVTRLDGDRCQSSIEALYPRPSPGGFVIVDDHGAAQGHRQAAHEMRDSQGIDEPLEEIDWTDVPWRRTAP